MNRVSPKVWAGCLLIVCVLSVFAFRNWQASRNQQQLAEAIVPQVDHEAAQTAAEEVAAPPEVPIGDLLAAAEVPVMMELDKAIDAKLRRLAKEEEEKQTDEPFVPGDSDSILEHEVSQRRTAWYRQAWLGSFQKYSRKDAAWSARAAELLEKTAAARRDAPWMPEQIRLELRPEAAELLKLGCDDPVVWAEMLSILDGGSPEFKNIKAQLFQRFLASDYPAHIAFWTGCPHISAEQLLKIQQARRAAASGGATSPFDVADPVDQRILLELLVERHRLRLLVEPLNKNPLWALEMSESASPWLKNMLLAYYTFSGTVDQAVMMAMAGERVDPRGKDFARIWNTLRRDPDFGNSLAFNRVKFAANFSLSAWYEFPDNPEAAVLLLDMIARQDVIHLDGSAPFWFREAVRAQLDYRPAYRLIQSWLAIESYASVQRANAGAERLAQECLNCGRFDTIVPAMYLDFTDFVAAQPSTEWALGLTADRSHREMRAMYARPEVNRAIERLVAGYAKNPPRGVNLDAIKSRLVCAAFLMKDFDKAAAQLETLGTNCDPAVFHRFKFSRRELEREVTRRATHPPFDLGSGKEVQYLAFARDGSALIGLGRDGQIAEFGLPDGNVVNHPEQVCRSLAVPMSGQQFVALDHDELGLRSLETFELTSGVEAADFIPINAAADAQKFWATAERDSDGENLVLKLRNFRDGRAEISLATSFVEIHSLAIASQAPVLAIHGLAADRETSQILPHIAVSNLESAEQLLHRRTDGLSVQGLALAPDATAVAIRAQDDVASQYGQLIYQIALLDLPSGEKRWESLSGEYVGCVQFLDDGRHLVTAGDDRLVRVWNRGDGEQRATFVGHNAGIRAMAYSSSRGLIATGDIDGRVRIWDVKENPDRHRAQGYLGGLQFSNLQQVAIDPTTEDILTCSQAEGTIRWRKDAGYQAGTAASFGCVDWTTDGRTLLAIPKQISGNNDVVTPKTFSLELQGPAAESLVRSITFESPRYVSARIFPDGRSLLTTGGVATVWNLESGEPRRWGLLLGHSSPVKEVDISADGNRMATLTHRPGYPAGHRAEVRVWEIPSDPDHAGAAAKSLFHHEGTVMNADLSGDGKLLVSVDVNAAKIDVWEVDTGRHLGTVAGTRAQFSPDSQQVAVAGAGSEILVYEIPSLNIVRRLSVAGYNPQHLCWGPSGETLCFVVEGWVRCLDIESGQELVPNTLF